MNHHDFAEAVHEFRRELSPRGFYRSAFHLLVKICHGLILWLDETHPALHQFRDFRAAQVRGHEDHGLREGHATVVAQRQGRVDLSQTVIFMTSNLGGTEITELMQGAFSNSTASGL